MDAHFSLVQMPLRKGGKKTSIAYSEPTITVNGQKASVRYIHLSGFVFSRVVHIDEKATASTAKFSVEFGKLRANVLERSRIILDTKLKVQKAMVLPILLYAYMGNFRMVGALNQKGLDPLRAK